MTILELLDRESEIRSRRNEIWADICGAFLAAHDEDPAPADRIAPFFCAEIDRLQAKARDYVERREWAGDRDHFEQRLTDLILDCDPIGWVMRDAAYEPLVWRNS